MMLPPRQARVFARLARCQLGTGAFILPPRILASGPKPRGGKYTITRYQKHVDAATGGSRIKLVIQLVVKRPFLEGSLVYFSIFSHPR